MASRWICSRGYEYLTICRYLAIPSTMDPLALWKPISLTLSAITRTRMAAIHLKINRQLHCGI